MPSRTHFLFFLPLPWYPSLIAQWASISKWKLPLPLPLRRQSRNPWPLLSRSWSLLSGIAMTKDYCRKHCSGYRCLFASDVNLLTKIPAMMCNTFRSQGSFAVSQSALISPHQGSLVFHPTSAKQSQKEDKQMEKGLPRIALPAV